MMNPGFNPSREAMLQQVNQASFAAVEGQSFTWTPIPAIPRLWLILIR